MPRLGAVTWLDAQNCSFNNKLTSSKNKLAVTFSYNFSLYGFLKPAPVAFYRAVPRFQTRRATVLNRDTPKSPFIFNSFLYFVAHNQKPF